MAIYNWKTMSSGGDGASTSLAPESGTDPEFSGDGFEMAVLEEGSYCVACSAHKDKRCTCPDDEFHIFCEECYKNGPGTCNQSARVPKYCSGCPAHNGMVCHCPKEYWTTCWGCMMGYENQQGHDGEGGCCRSDITNYLSDNSTPSSTEDLREEEQTTPESKENIQNSREETTPESKERKPKRRMRSPSAFYSETSSADFNVNESFLQKPSAVRIPYQSNSGLSGKKAPESHTVRKSVSGRANVGKRPYSGTKRSFEALLLAVSERVKGYIYNDGISRHFEEDDATKRNYDDSEQKEDTIIVKRCCSVPTEIPF